MESNIIVFRYGHREVRDYRVSSHCALVARAFGAKKIIVCGEEDIGMKNSVDSVTKRWGGPFKVEFVKNWQLTLKKIKKQGFVLVHLTMYGESVEKVDKKISKEKKICIIIGSQKVEREVYEIADYNVGVTQQPHSEIAALAVFMDRIQNGKELSNKFKQAERRIQPSQRGKSVIALK
jgi:tRNA (cytidine56-2'-O)-methyltransferase